MAEVGGGGAHGAEGGGGGAHNEGAPPSDAILFPLVCFSIGIFTRLCLKWTRVPYTAMLLVRRGGAAAGGSGRGRRKRAAEGGGRACSYLHQGVAWCKAYRCNAYKPANA